MFTENMIAPCGLDCSLCNEALKRENPCAGCMGSDDNKPEFCSKHCTIINCKNLVNNRFRFCTECMDYPCEFNNERESRYMSQYVMKESPLSNLEDIKNIGINEFLTKQHERWTCKKCSGIICVHTGICSKCGETYRAEDITIVTKYTV